MRVIHIITGGKGRGGAEGALLRLVKGTSNTVQHIVYTLLDMPDYENDFRKAGVALRSLNIRSPKSFPLNLYRLKKEILSHRPDIIQSWMGHSNLLFGLIGKAWGVPVVWNIRQSRVTKQELGSKNYALMKISANLSKVIPYKIINCSLKSIEMHRKVGFDDKFVYIPNGVNINSLHPESFQSQPKGSFTVGHVGRYDPAKNHTLFISAFKDFNDHHTSARCIMAGTGVSCDNPIFRNNYEDLINSSFTLLGQVENKTKLSKVYKQMDCLVLSSVTEGFPNVLIEAMSFGIPCISTKVGDASEIISDTGWIVPSDDQEALENALEEAYHEYMNSSEKWAARRKKAYDRVIENYSIEKMCERYVNVWNEAINQSNHNRRKK
ncbi:Putative glycosyltransferase EpsF [Psychrobacter pasteurii]|uniref:Putative glycosyltransferase EpsF n=1 Tax=Psychrobacter pasteurii TaxID=1945520 RepID=A0A1R4EJ23_9GAMM|nr:glycosyltransferase [Psychrobacter pasteurii]SJM38463.1 Putative glycosyltransferase EpsF [Psychrobacter pasteurii]